MRKLPLALLALFFCGAVMTGCDDGKKDDKEETPAAMPTPQDYGGGG